MSPGAVYFVQAGANGPIKVGFATDVVSRLRVLQSSHYEKLTLLLAVSSGRHVESALHFKFQDAHIRGEWFRPTPEFLARIDALRASPHPDADLFSMALEEAGSAGDTIAALKMRVRQLEATVARLTAGVTP